MHLWDRLLIQATLTLNLLRPSRMNPKLSVYAYLNGPFNYMATPIAPPGIKVEIHQKPTQRPSFGYHSISGFILAQLSITTDATKSTSQVHQVNALQIP